VIKQRYHCGHRWPSTADDGQRWPHQWESYLSRDEPIVDGSSWWWTVVNRVRWIRRRPIICTCLSPSANELQRLADIRRCPATGCHGTWWSLNSTAAVSSRGASRGCRVCRATFPFSLPRAYLIGRPAVRCGVVLPVCPCVVWFSRLHARLVADIFARTLRGKCFRGISAQRGTTRLADWQHTWEWVSIGVPIYVHLSRRPQNKAVVAMHWDDITVTAENRAAWEIF